MRASEIQEYQRKLIDTILSPKTTLGCLVAPFGYGKTSTAIGLWQAAIEAKLLAIPPFSCSSVAELAQSIATGVNIELHSTDPEAAANVLEAYDAYLISSADQLAQQDADEYQISIEAAQRSIQDKLSRGLLTLEASGIHLLKFLDQLVNIVLEAGYSGLFIIVDEFQQFLGNVNKAVITNFRTLVWGLKTRQKQPFGFLFTMDPDTERTLSDRAGDILHRIKEDGLYLNFANIYDREFPRLLWDRYASTFDFQGKSADVVDRATLEAIGQICERTDLSNGPRTVINAFQHIATFYDSRNRPYTPLDIIDDFLTGTIKFDGDRNKIASLVTELTGYDYIKRSPNRVNALKLIAAFPRGCTREIAEQYTLTETFDQLSDELRGEILTELPEGIALIDLQRVGKPQNKLNIILKKYWLQITESEIISDRILSLFGEYVIEALFPPYANDLSGWRRETKNFTLTPTGTYWQVYEGTYSREYPLRRVCVQICGDLEQAIDPMGLMDELDLNLVFVLHTNDEHNKGSKHYSDRQTLVLHLPLRKPFGLPLARDVRWIEDYLRPVIMSPEVLISLLDYIEHQQSAIEGITNSEQERINDTQAKLQNFLLTMLIDNTLFDALETSILARGAPALAEALFHICRTYYPNYQTLITLSQWRSLLENYQSALEANKLSLLQRHGIEPLIDAKANIAKLFGLSKHAGFQSQAKQLNLLLDVIDWRGDQGTITFKQHPGETYLFKQVSQQREMGEDALLQAGRRAGYTFEESKYLIEFLQRRGYLEYLPEQAVFHPISMLSSIEVDELNQKIQRELTVHKSVLTNDADLDHIETDLTDIQIYIQQPDQLDNLQVRLLYQQQRLLNKREQLIGNLRNQLGSAHKEIHQIIEHLNQPLPLLSSDVMLATHLNGAQRTIVENHPPAIRRLEKLSNSIAKFLKESYSLTETSLERLPSVLR